MSPLSHDRMVVVTFNIYDIIVSMKIRSDVKRKALLLLASGVALGLVSSPKKYFRILENLPKAWKEINRRRLVRIVREFYRDRLIAYKEKPDGTIQIILTKEGNKHILEYKLDNIKIQPHAWDKVWRVIIFDIPERFRAGRDALREKLKDLGFLELQKSVFIYPYKCEDEINFIVEVFKIRSYVRIMEVKSFTNDEHYKLKFKLY